MQIDDLHIANSEEELLLDWKPKLVVKTYSFKIKVEGLEYVSSIVGSVEGMAGCYCLGRCCGKMNDAPIYFEAQGRSGEVTGSFTAFGLPEGAMSRASLAIKFTLAFIKVDKTVQKAEIDITEVIADFESGEGGEGDVDEPPTEIELPLDDQIEVERPENPPSGDGGGIGGDVDGWGDEDEVILPVE